MLFASYKYSGKKDNGRAEIEGYGNCVIDLFEGEVRGINGILELNDRATSIISQQHPELTEVDAIVMYFKEIHE